MGARWKHFKTVCKHKAVVYQECKACGITWQGIVHDLSKFSSIEFSASAKHFQGNRSPIEAEKEDCGYEFRLFEDNRYNLKSEIDIDRCPRCKCKLDWSRWHRINERE